MNMLNNNNGFFFLPLTMITDFDETKGVKTAHHRQNVYVNGDYIGDKISLAQNDGGLQAVEDYLESRGFRGYTLSQEGDQIHIDVEDEKEGENIKNHLEVYTKIR